MRRIVALFALSLVIGCAKESPRPLAPPPEAATAPDPFFTHRVERAGETLGEIARWYTGKYGNWLILTKPVNPDLEKCCTPLKAGREVNIPRHLMIRTDPMPEPKKEVVRPAKPAKKTEPREDVAPPHRAIGEAPPSEAPSPTAEEEDTPSPAAPLAEAPGSSEAPSPAESSGSASGTVKMRGQSWKVADALAYPDGDAVHVALSSEPFDRKEAVKDGKVDDFDVMSFRMKANANTLTVKIDKDGGVNCVDYSLQAGGGSSCGTAPQEGWKLGKQTASAVSGKLVYTDGDDQVDVRFDTPVLRKVKRAGTSLPPGGGEPGKAVLERFEANRSGNFEKIKALTAPDDRSQMDGISAEEKKMALEFMELSTPSNVKITGGTIDGDTAQVDFVGKGDGAAKVKGTAEAKRVGGKWYVGSISTGP